MKPRTRRSVLGPLAIAAAFSCATGGLVAQESEVSERERRAGVAVQGRVVDHAGGQPVRSAAVSLAAGPGATSGLGTRVTDEEGRFLFRDVPAGVYRLSVTALGYRAMRDTLRVPSETDLELVLPLSVEPIRLEPVVVEVERGWEVRERESRRSRAAFVVTRDEIEDRYPSVLTDLLRTVPGGLVVPTSGFGNAFLLRGRCRPGIWIDRVRLLDVRSIDELVPPQDVEAIEVFHSSELPVEFGANACGGVLIWTRVGAPPEDEPRAGLWRRLGIAAGFLLLGVLLSR